MPSMLKFGKLLGPLALVLAFCLALPVRADDNGKGKEKPAAKVADVDVEKLVQEVTRRVLEELRAEKKGAPKKEEFKKHPPKGEVEKKVPNKLDFAKKGEGKPHLVIVDLNKLPPDIAQQVAKFAEEFKKGDHPKDGGKGKKGEEEKRKEEFKKGDQPKDGGKGKKGEDQKSKPEEKKNPKGE